MRPEIVILSPSLRSGQAPRRSRSLGFDAEFFGRRDADGMPRTYFVYILASDSHELYVGVTNDLHRRLSQHRSSLNRDSYTTKHRTTRLVYCESTSDVRAAIRREKQIKGWTRKKKLELVDQANPDWRDLAEGL